MMARPQRGRKILYAIFMSRGQRQRSESHETPSDASPVQIHAHGTTRIFYAGAQFVKKASPTALSPP